MMEQAPPAVTSPPIVARLHSFFKQSGLRLSVAESCTGGLISHYITNLPGASLFFEGSAITYSIDMKRNILGVSSETLSRYGAVSSKTAIEMAEGIQRITGSDWAIATTGNLGPDVLEGKERGLVYIAVRDKERTFVKELHLKGERLQNKEEASIKALEFLMEVLLNSGRKDG